MRSILISSKSMGHTNSCVPCALSTLLDKPYDQVNEWLKGNKYRKSNNGGTRTSAIKMSDFGMDRVIDWRTRTEDARNGKSKMTVRRFVAEHPTGNYFILVSGHGLALKNGIVYDTMRDSSRRYVQTVYQRNDFQKLPSDFDKYANVVPFDASKRVRPTPYSPVRTVKVPRGEKTRLILAHFEVIGTGACTIKELIGISGASYIFCRYMLIERKRMQDLKNK